MGYDAFISYSHAADGRLAPRVQSALHRFAKPLLSLRALHIFRDQTSLAATPELWSTIVGALDQSRHFILMASPESAASVWVQREVEHWLTQSPSAKGGEAIQHLLIILTEGEILWDPAAGDFDWMRTDALPRQLGGAFPEEPLYVDMRAVKTEDHLSLQNPEFRNQIADLASTIHGRPKDELIGEDVRIVRRNKRLAWSASIGLAFLAIAASVMAVVATVQRDAARSREMAARAVSQLGVDPHESLQLAIQGVEIDWTDEAASALREALLRSHRRARLSSAGPVREARFGPNGVRILGTACSPDESECVVQLWSATTGDAICAISGIRSARFTSDGGRVVSEDERVFDAETCEPTAVDPSGVSLVEAPRKEFEVVEDDYGPFIRDRGSGEITRRLAVLRDPIGGHVFSPDNRYVVTWSDEAVYYESGGGPTEIGDKAARLWGARYGDSDAVLVGHDRAINTAAFSSDASFVVTGSDDRTARVWIRNSGEGFAVLRGHSDAVDAVAMSPDGSRVVTVERNGTAWLWEPGTTAPVESDFERLFALRYGVPLPDLQGEKQPAVIPQLSGDGSTIVAAVSLSEIGVWDAATGERRALLTDEGFGHLRGWPCPDGGRVVTVNGDPRVMAGDEVARVWDVDSGRVTKTLDGEDGPLFGAACSPDGATIVTVSAGGTARLWNAVTLELLRNNEVDGGGRILDVSFSNDGSRFVTAHRDAVARIWDARTGELQLRLFGHAGGVLRAAFSPDDRLVVTVGDDHTRIWDAATGKQVGDYLGSGEGTVFIAHDCSKLVVGEYGDKRVRIHDFGACGPNDVVLALARKRVGDAADRDAR